MAKETTENWPDINIFISHALLNFSGKHLLNFNISWYDAESLSSLMGNRRAITALHNHNKDTKSLTSRQKLADATMTSKPVAEFAHEHHGLEFATQPAFLCCPVRQKTVSGTESLKTVWYQYRPSVRTGQQGE